MSRPLRLLREAALWIAAAIGTLCLACTVAAVGFGITPLIFSSGSMSPGIPTGSLALAISTPGSELKPGDIVSTDWSDGQRVTHRLVSVEQVANGGWQLTTRGDANNVADAEHPVIEKVDRLIWSAPGWGYVIDELTKPQWVFLMGVAVGGLLILAFRGTRRAERRQPRSEPRHAGGARHGAGGTGIAVVGGVVALALGASLLAPAPTATLATYTDSGQAAGVFGTATIPAPTISGCVITNNGLGIFQSVTVTFAMPAGYPKTSAVIGAAATAGAIAPLSPAPTIGGTGPYTYTFTANLLESILASLFGNSAYVGVRTADGTWNSAWTTRKVSIGLLGLGSTCTLS